MTVEFPLIFWYPTSLLQQYTLNEMKPPYHVRKTLFPAINAFLLFAFTAKRRGGNFKRIKLQVQ